MDNLDLALKDGNFGLLGKNRKNAIAGTTEKVTNLEPIGMQGVGGLEGVTVPEIPDLTVPKIQTNGLVNALKLGTNQPAPAGQGLAAIPQIENMDEYFLNN